METERPLCSSRSPDCSRRRGSTAAEPSRSSRTCSSKRSRSTACAVSTEPMRRPVRRFDLDAAWRLTPQVSIRPERFGALLYHFGTRRLSFLKSPALLDVVARRWRAPAERAGGVRRGRGPGRPAAGVRSARSARLAQSRTICARAAVVTAAPASLVEQFELGSGRADLPDLGAHVRVQPGVRALPVELRAARPARADHRAVQGGHRRARADAGLLREHRRRRADGAAGLLGAARLRHRPPRRREVLHQRGEDHAGGGPPAGGHGLRRRADLPGRRDRRGERRGPRRRARTTPRSRAMREPGRRRLRAASRSPWS